MDCTHRTVWLGLDMWGDVVTLCLDCNAKLAPPIRGFALRPVLPVKYLETTYVSPIKRGGRWIY